MRPASQFATCFDLMPVPMVSVGDVRVRVAEACVCVDVSVRGGHLEPVFVFMLMVLVMRMEVIVHERLMAMHVAVPFTEQKHDADKHRSPSASLDHAKALAKYQHGDNCAKEWSRCEICCLACRAYEP